MKNYSDKLDKKGARYLEVLKKNVVRMEKFILDLLELSKAGKVLGKKEDVDIIELLNQIYNDFKPQLEQDKIKLKKEFLLSTVYQFEKRKMIRLRNVALVA